VSFRLDHQRALVTGGSGGLGRAIAEALRQAGARVVVVGRSAKPSNAICRDLTQSGELAKAIGEAVDRLDILVVAHGIARRGAAEDFSRADWDDTLHTNLTSAFEIAQAAGRQFLKQQRGKIIFIASMLSFSGGWHASAYAASKGGIAQLTKALCNEWAAHGINVNAIAPGYFETPLTEPLRADPTRSQPILDRLPAGRWGRPDDLTGAVVFLASPASDYVHGIILPVDGGWLAR